MILKDKLISLPIVKQLVALLKSVRLSKNAFSLYDLLHLYIVGIIKGTVTTRASAISYSFFLAIFPFLLFILNLIPYIPIEKLSGRLLVVYQRFVATRYSRFFFKYFL